MLDEKAKNYRHSFFFGSEDDADSALAYVEENVEEAIDPFQSSDDDGGYESFEVCFHTEEKLSEDVANRLIQSHSAETYSYNQEV